MDGELGVAATASPRLGEHTHGILSKLAAKNDPWSDFLDDQ